MGTSFRFSSYYTGSWHRLQYHRLAHLKNLRDRQIPEVEEGKKGGPTWEPHEIGGDSISVSNLHISETEVHEFDKKVDLPHCL